MIKVHCKHTVVATVLALALLAGCGGGSDSGIPADPGQAAFNRHCAGCHGQQGQGRAPAFPPLAGSEWLTLPPEGLTTIVLLGLRGTIEVAGRQYAGYMPPMQHLDDQRVAAIVNHVKRRFADDEPEWTASNVAAVRAALAGQTTPQGRAGLDRLLEELP